MDVVAALLAKWEISEVYPVLSAAGIDKLVSLRALSEERLKELVPDDAQRAKLIEGLNKSSDVPAAAAPPPEAPVDPRKVCKYFNTPMGCKKGADCNLLHIDSPMPDLSGPPQPRPRRVCRDFLEPGGCKFGADCKFSHDPADRLEPDAPVIPSETFTEDITVPFDSVKLLLGNKAERMVQIHKACGTTNSRIDKPDGVDLNYTIKIRGSKEGVAKARTMIERFVGIAGMQCKEARFQYANNELDRNCQSVQWLCALNARRRGTPMELSSQALERVCQTFRFQQPPLLTQFWTLASHNDRDKFEIVQKFVRHLDSVQCIVFTEAKRVEEMAKRVTQTASAFGVKAPQFVHRGISKEERMKALEAFKKGEVSDQGKIQRLLVTSNDYAKLARKIAIPFVNLIVHFAVPPSKEFFTLQSMCTGRNGHTGICVMFITSNDASLQKDWSESFPLSEFTEEAFAAACQKLKFDTVQNPLNPPDADPPENWRELAAQPKKKEKEKPTTPES